MHGDRLAGQTVILSLLAMTLIILVTLMEQYAPQTYRRIKHTALLYQSLVIMAIVIEIGVLLNIFRMKLDIIWGFGI